MHFAPSFHNSLTLALLLDSFLLHREYILVPQHREHCDQNNVSPSLVTGSELQSKPSASSTVHTSAEHGLSKSLLSIPCPSCCLCLLSSLPLQLTQLTVFVHSFIPLICLFWDHLLYLCAKPNEKPPKTARPLGSGGKWTSMLG